MVLEAVSSDGRRLPHVLGDPLLLRRWVNGPSVSSRGVQRAKTSSAIPSRRVAQGRQAFGPGTASATLTVTCPSEVALVDRHSIFAGALQVGGPPLSPFGGVVRNSSLSRYSLGPSWPATPSSTHREEEVATPLVLKRDRNGDSTLVGLSKKLAGNVLHGRRAEATTSALADASPTATAGCDEAISTIETGPWALPLDTVPPTARTLRCQRNCAELSLSLLNHVGLCSQRDSGGSGGEFPGELSTDSTIATTEGRSRATPLSRSLEEATAPKSLECVSTVTPTSSCRRSIANQELLRRVRSGAPITDLTTCVHNAQLPNDDMTKHSNGERRYVVGFHHQGSPYCSSQHSPPGTPPDSPIRPPSVPTRVLRAPGELRVVTAQSCTNEVVNGMRATHVIPAMRRSPLEAAAAQSMGNLHRVQERGATAGRPDRRLRGLRSNMRMDDVVSFPRAEPHASQRITGPQQRLSPRGAEQEAFSTGQIMSITSLLGTVEYGVSIKAGIDEKVLALLPISKFDASKNKLSGEHRQCMVCLMDFWDGDNLRWLPCLHHFHCECIDTWLRKSARTCPICKCDVEKSHPPLDPRQNEDCRLGLSIDSSGRRPILHHTPQALGATPRILYPANVLLGVQQRAENYSRIRQQRPRHTQQSPRISSDLRLRAA